MIHKPNIFTYSDKDIGVYIWAYLQLVLQTDIQIDMEKIFLVSHYLKQENPNYQYWTAKT